jgi:ribosome maturation factor RimP
MKWVSKPTFLLYTGFVSMGSLEDNLYKWIQPLCDEEEIFLVDISLHGENRNRLIKIIVDTETGITLSHCQILSKKISDIFFRKDLFQGNYRIEVSSPGTNKPLEKPFEFRRSIGKDLSVNFREEGEMRTITGQLLNFDKNEITLQQKNDTISISLSDIDEAKIKLKW